MALRALCTCAHLRCACAYAGKVVAGTRARFCAARSTTCVACSRSVGRCTRCLRPTDDSSSATNSSVMKSKSVCSYQLQQCDAMLHGGGELTALPQTSRLDFGERKGGGKGKGDGKEKEGRRGEGDKGREEARKGRRETGMGKGRNFVLFRWEKPCNPLSVE